MSGRMLGHVFSVAGVKMPICTLNFPGAKNISENKLREVTKQELAEADYSREIVRGFAGLKLHALYREVGQLQARFGTPEGKPDAKCKNGVEVTLPVTEGLIYSWDPTNWSGMNTLTADQLNSLLGAKVGEVANGLKFDKGITNVVKAYGRQGYIEARLRPQAEFNDSSQRVTYKIAVNEGPQYRMGSLLFKGLTERDAKALRNAWRLKRGDIFDQGYLDDFFKEDARDVFQRMFQERRSAGKPPPQIQTGLDRHKDSLTVDVTLELGN
jgi:outer membrane protein assembly factor BamA